MRKTETKLFDLFKGVDHELTFQDTHLGTFKTQFLTYIDMVLE